MKINLLYIPFLLILFSNCDNNSRKDPGNQETFPVVKVLNKDTVLNSEYITDIHACMHVEIRARVSGFLDKIYIDEGQEVKKGQPLFSINDEEYKAALAKTKAFLNSAIAEAKGAEVEVQKVRKLVEKNVVSKTELEVAEAKWIAALSKVEEAKSAVSNARIRLSYAHIKAPFDGIVDRIPLKAGSLINEGSLLTSLSDIHEVYTYFNVSENEYLTHVKSGLQSPHSNHTQVRLILSDGSSYQHEGKIETLEGEIDRSTGSIAFRAKFPNPDKILKHGSSGKLIIRNKIKDAMIIPQKCVFEIQDKNFVYLLDSSNKARMKSIVTQARLNECYIIKSGLKPGNTILFEGFQNMQDGDHIIPQPVSMDSLMRNKF